MGHRKKIIYSVKGSKIGYMSGGSKNLVISINPDSSIKNSVKLKKISALVIELFDVKLESKAYRLSRVKQKKRKGERDK